MKNFLLLSIISVSAFLSGPLKSYGQKTCGFDGIHEAQMQSDPIYRSKLEAFEKLWQEKQELLQNTANKVVVNGTDTTYEIPVVFHVIHTGSAIGTQFNPTDAHIQSVVNYLNQTFAATWPGFPTTATGGANIPIRFVLAKRDSLCNATTGINRINGVTALGANGSTYNTYGVQRQSTNGITDVQLKALVQWNPSFYYNIWVVNKIDGWSGYVSGSGVTGYAYFAGASPSLDGTVIMEAFNTPGENTLPHELGHAFNLYHTFQGGCAAPSGCATNGDRICDTDPHDQVYLSCPSGNNPCTGTSWAPLKNNIMNYGDCADRFTAAQGQRALTTLLTQRAMLNQSLGGTSPGASVTFPAPIALSGCSNPGITNPSNNSDMGPTNILIADLESYSGGYNGDGNVVYFNHTGTCLLPAITPAHMAAGQAYTVNVGTGYNPENVRVYIDFDNNGTFNTATETVFTSNGVIGDHYRIHNGNTIIIPSSGVTNTSLRMRVLSDFYGNASPVPCGSNLQYGQIEDFTVIITNNPLPVSISNIEANVATDGKSIDVKWNAEQESNLNRYEIERSTDGKSFARIGTLSAKGNHAKYLFNDASPEMEQLNFYRLKMVDKDQSFIYSKIVSASLNSITSASLQVYPNPANDLLNIDLSVKGSYDLFINNELGQVVYTREELKINQHEPAQISLKESAFTPGIYYLRLVEKSGVSYNGKFVKQ